MQSLVSFGIAPFYHLLSWVHCIDTSSNISTREMMCIKFMNVLMTLMQNVLESLSFSSYSIKLFLQLIDGLLLRDQVCP